MIDYAAKLIEENGFKIASERISGVNDNMHLSHYHEYFEIYYLEFGERYHLINDNIHHVTAGQFLLFEPFILHHSYGDKDIPFSRLLVYFKKDLIETIEMIDSLKDCTGVYKLDMNENNRVHNIMEKILEEQNHSKEHSQEYLKVLINMLLIILIRNKNFKSTANFKNKITNVITYINENYSKKITIKFLSQYFFISQGHLCRQFKYHTNTTIIQYINNIRIINAQKLLSQQNKNITEICLEVGFESITHFERIFKNSIGLTPSQYRKRNLF